MKTTKNVLVGLLAGATAGAVLGVLLAPGKGAETRRKILSKSGKLADDAKDKFNSFVDKSAKKAETIHEETEDLIAKGKPKFGEPKLGYGNTAM